MNSPHSSVVPLSARAVLGVCRHVSGAGCERLRLGGCRRRCERSPGFPLLGRGGGRGAGPGWCGWCSSGWCGGWCGWLDGRPGPSRLRWRVGSRYDRGDGPGRRRAVVAPTACDPPGGRRRAVVRLCARRLDPAYGLGDQACDPSDGRGQGADGGRGGLGDGEADGLHQVPFPLSSLCLCLPLLLCGCGRALCCLCPLDGVAFLLSLRVGRRVLLPCGCLVAAARPLHPMEEQLGRERVATASAGDGAER